MSIFRVGVVIPVFNGAVYLRRQLPVLWSQTIRPVQIVVLDSSSTDDSAEVAQEAGCVVRVIPKAEFNHGETRNLGARILGDEVDVIVFLTQDALPVDESFIAALISPIGSGIAAGAYARQRPYPEATPPEAFTRGFNYPSKSRLRTIADVETIGLKAFFFSNVASAVDRRCFFAVGGFPSDVIMNEDMVLCARLLSAGKTVFYCAEAEVLHSHNYNLKQQFRRYFDIGAFLAGSSEVGGKVGGEGFRFVRGQLAWCWRNKAKTWIPRCLAEASLKFIGLQLGKRQRLLPRWLKRQCSMHAFFWR